MAKFMANYRRGFGRSICQTQQRGYHSWCWLRNFFITTKVWACLHRYEDVLGSVKDSLTKLCLDCVDLHLVHWPIAAEKETPDGKVFFSIARSHRTTQEL